MSRKKSVIVVGPSGSGKSTLVDQLRGPEFDDRVVVPKRVITLPVRADSDPTENRNVSEAVFRKELAAGRIKPWWDRQLGDEHGQRHLYGFERVPKHDDRLRLFLGNNALLAANSPRVHKLFAQSLVVVVTADPEVRGERLDIRLPDMGSAEKAQRVCDGLERLQDFNPLGIVTLDTTDQPHETSRQQFIDTILQHAATPTGNQSIELASSAPLPVFV